MPRRSPSRATRESRTRSADLAATPSLASRALAWGSRLLGGGDAADPVARAARAACEPLESRLLFITTTDIGSIASGQFEYKDGRDNTVRVVWENLLAEFVFLAMDEEAGINALRELPIPAGSDDDGRDMFAIYVAESSVDSRLAIAVVPDPNDDGEPRPMQPFEGGVDVTATNLNNGEREQFSAGPGDVLIGGLIESESEFLDGQPILSRGMPSEGIGILGPRPGNRLAAGIVVEEGQDFGRMLIGGTVLGSAVFGGSVDTFYAGGILTGNAQGIGTGGTAGAGNFSVAGDLRNLFVGGSMGTEAGAPAEADDPNYLSGFDLRVGGAIGQVRAGGQIYGSATALNGTNVMKLRYRLNELEERSNLQVEDRGNFTHFQIFQFGDEQDNDNLFVNDTFDTPQFLGTFKGRSGGDQQIVLNGNLQYASGGVDYDDVADFYGLGLMAGQTITVDLTGFTSGFGGPAFEAPGALAVAIFDPDGRLVASDYSNKALAGDVNNNPFQYTARRPGAHRIAVARLGNADFATGGEFVDEKVAGGWYPYTLTVQGAAHPSSPGGVGIGGIAAVGNIFENTGLGFRAQNGDFGAIEAGGFLMTSPSGLGILVDDGDLRSASAAAMAITGDQIRGGVNVSVPLGSVGHVRTTDAAGAMGLNTLGIPIQGRTPLAGSSLVVGGDYQRIDAAGTYAGQVVANRRIGTFNAGNMAVIGFQSVFAANDDGVGDDGIIDLIDVTGDFGTIGNGPVLSAGPGGNIRYIRVGGIAFRDPAFGGGQPEQITSTAGEPVNITDDSGTPVRINPYPLIRQINPVTGLFELVNPPTLTVLTLPVRGTRTGVGGSGGSVILEVDTTNGVEVLANTISGRGSAEIGLITSSGVGVPVEVNTRGTPDPSDDVIRLDQPATLPESNPPYGINDASILLRGNATVDVLETTGGQLVQVSNTTPNGELVSVNATSVGLIRATNIGLPKSHTGYGFNNVNGIQYGLNEVTPIDAFNGPGDVFPFNQQTYGVSADTIVEVFATQALGNIVATGGAVSPTLTTLGTIGSVRANADNAGVRGVHEGINAPVYASGRIVSVNIGEGLLPSGTGNLSNAGIYANDFIGQVSNQGLGSDLRGDVVSETGINAIDLSGGAIIGSDIMVITDETGPGTGSAFLSSRDLDLAPRIINEFPDSVDDPIFQIGRVTANNGGGIIGSAIVADDIGDVISSGGFGIFSTIITVVGSGIVDNVIADGYGIRESQFLGGAVFNNVQARGTGGRLKTTAWTPSVRLSDLLDRGQFDPYTGQGVGRMSDLHVYLGTSAAEPRRKGWSNPGAINDTFIRASRNLNNVVAETINASEFSLGNTINNITVRRSTDFLTIRGGRLNNVRVGEDVHNADWGIGGPIGTVITDGTWQDTSSIRATGPNGFIDVFRTGRALLGSVFANVDINNVEVGTDLGAQGVFISRQFEGIETGRDLRNLTVDRHVLDGTRVRVGDDLFQLNIGGDVQEGALIDIDDQLLGQVIKGQVFGDIVVGNP